MAPASVILMVRTAELHPRKAEIVALYCTSGILLRRAYHAEVRKR